MLTNALNGDRRHFIKTVTLLLGLIVSLFLVSQINNHVFAQSAQSTVSIRARGYTGAENMDLRINGQSVASFTNLSTSMSTYKHVVTTPTVIDSIRVHFDNDGLTAAGDDKNIQIDYLEIDGTRYETEASNTRSKGFWTSGSGCAEGYKQHEVLACIGWAEYEAAQGVSLAQAAASGDTSSDVVVRARGYGGGESMDLRINDQTVANFNNLSTTMADYRHTVTTQTTIDSIKVHFTNDQGVGHDIDLDYLEIDGTRYETEATTTKSVGVWTDETRCTEGYKQSQFFACNGWVEYEAAKGLTLAASGSDGSGNSAPGKIQAENYTAYNDADGQNGPTANGDCRSGDNRDLKTAGEDCLIGWIDPGDWYEWEVNAQESGTYTLGVRYANGESYNSGARFIVNGQPALTVGDIAPTGAWDGPLSSLDLGTVTLSSGTNTIRFEQVEYIDLDYLVLTPLDSGEDQGGSDSGSGNSAPGKIQAENYTAYNDADGQNDPAANGNCRTDDNRDLKASGDGCTIGWIDPGDWYEWEVNAQEAGDYSLDLRYANGESSNTSVRFLVNGKPQLSTAGIPSTGDWSSPLTSANVGTLTLQSGTNTIRFEQVEYIDLDYLVLTPVDSSGNDQGGADDSGSGGPVDLTGCETVKPLGLTVASDAESEFSVWVRAKANASASKLGVRLSDQCVRTVVDASNDDWEWYKADKRMTLEEGSQVVGLHLESGEVLVDKVLFVVDGDCKPEGDEGEGCILEEIEATLLGIEQDQTVSAEVLVSAETKGLSESGSVKFMLDGDQVSENVTSGDGIFCMGALSDGVCGTYDISGLDEGNHTIEMIVVDRGREVKVSRDFGVVSSVESEAAAAALVVSPDPVVPTLEDSDSGGDSAGGTEKEAKDEDTAEEPAPLAQSSEGVPILVIDSADVPSANLTGEIELTVSPAILKSTDENIVYTIDDEEVGRATVKQPKFRFDTRRLTNRSHRFGARVLSASGERQAVEMSAIVNNSPLHTLRVWFTSAFAKAVIGTLLIGSAAVIGYFRFKRHLLEKQVSQVTGMNTQQLSYSAPIKLRFDLGRYSTITALMLLLLGGIVLAAPNTPTYSGNASIIVEAEDGKVDNAYQTASDGDVDYVTLNVGVSSGPASYKIQAENYTAYNDADGQNDPAANGNCRTDDNRDLKASGDGCTIGWIDPGDWYEWEVNAQEAGDYSLDLRYANGEASNALVDFSVNGQPQINDAALSPTGSWSALATNRAGILTLQKGTNTVRFEQAGFIDIDYLTLTGPGAVGDTGGGSAGSKAEGVVAIGDSLLHQENAWSKLQQRLESDGWNKIAINAEGCRGAGDPNACSNGVKSFSNILQEVQASTYANNTVVAVGDLNTAIRNYDTIVIGLGVNDKPHDVGQNENKIRTVINRTRAINADIKIHWLTVCSRQGAVSAGTAFNKALQNVKSELNINIIDWGAACQESHMRGANDVHLNDSGSTAYVDAIVSGIDTDEGGSSGSGGGTGGETSGPPPTGYAENLAYIKGVTSYRNTTEDNSPYRNTPSAQLPVQNLYGPRSEYLGNPAGNPEQSFPVANGGQFRTGCEFSHFAYDDPLVYPNQPGKSHLHMFFGNTDVNAYSTYETLLNTGGATCNGQELNRTGYWAPALFDSSGNVRIPERVVVYYKGEGLARGNSTVYPAGAAFLASENINAISGATGGAAGKFSFVCSDQWSGVSSPASNTMAACDGSRFYNAYGVTDNPHAVLEMNVKFPQCWNGQNPSDYANNYRRPRSGSWYYSLCDAGFNTTLPNLEYFINYRVDIGENTNNWYLASDVNNKSFVRDKVGGSTVHADWWGAWHKQTNQTWIDNCVNYKNPSGAASGCGFGYLSDGGPDGNNPYSGPALKYREQYTGPHKVQAQTVFKDLCKTSRSYVRPESAAWCNP